MTAAYLIPGYPILQCSCRYRIDIEDCDESYIVCPECGKIYEHINGQYISAD